MALTFPALTPPRAALLRARVTPAFQLKAARFVEAQHPRDRNGRWIEKFAFVSVWGGGQGQVTGWPSADRVDVRRTDGSMIQVDSDRVTVLKNAGRRAVGRPQRRPPGARPAEPGGAAPAPSTPRERGVAPEPGDATAAYPGSRTAAGAEPHDAFAYFETEDGSAAAWLDVEDGQPTGFLRPDADDPATTLTFDEEQAWQDAVEGLDMEEKPVPAVGAGPADEGGPVDVDLAKVSSYPDDERGAPADWLDEMYTDGIAAEVDVVDDLSLDMAAPAAKAEVVADLTRRIEHVDDETLLGQETAARIRALQSGEVVRLRRPDPEKPSGEGFDHITVTRSQYESWAARAGAGGLGELLVTRVDPETYRREERAAMVNRFVVQWATTSNDSNPRSLAIQEVARDLFGLEDTAEWRHHRGTPTAAADAIAEQRGDNEQVWTELLLAQYDATQERFAENDITHVRLYRGHNAWAEDLGNDDWVDDVFDGYDPAAGTNVEVPLRPMTSFSYDPTTAVAFAAGRDGPQERLVMEGVVPVERVISTPRTGVGSLAEREVVVLGGPGEWNVKRASDFDPGLYNEERSAAIVEMPAPEDDVIDPEVASSKGRPDGEGTPDDPIDVQGDIARAAELLTEGKHVRLNQYDEVATLIDRLGELARDAEAQGDQAPNVDLCQVSVRGTNLFCAHHRGIQRIDMPQLKGIPIPGSPADLTGTKNKRGSVDVSAAFKEWLAEQGIGTEDKTVSASHLRATQMEMNGQAVAGMVQAMRAGSLADHRIFVTRDGYVIDGHHRWAAKVGIDTEDNVLGDVDMDVSVVDLDIGAAIDLANQFSRQQGLAREGVEAAGAPSPEGGEDYWVGNEPERHGPRTRRRR